MNKLDSLEPDFRKVVIQLLDNISRMTKREWRVVSGRRTMAEQTALYAQGRTTPGKVVTKAPAGSSPHNFGLAADICPMLPDGSDFDWDAPKWMWRAMAEMASGMGLQAGYYFTSIFDAPHVEALGWKIQQAKWKAGELKVA